MKNITKNPETESAIYKTLLESTKAIPWKIDWKTMQFAYIGPQIEPLLGWTPASWRTANDWAERMHPEDRAFTVNFCVSQSKEGIDHEADYRALTKDGGYVWIRDVVHVVRDAAGEVESLVGFMFDISERKKNEEELLRLQKELEVLSFTDALTGIANRRRFDAILAREWENARVHQQPLSVILLDLDFFKQYNDCHGHLQGDECLRRVAGAFAGATRRGRDFLARFGGEEFVLVLPDTDAAAARTIAERCRALLFKEQIPHPQSAVGQILTMSAGIGTVTPTDRDEPLAFIDEVDRLLYRAKHDGRNRIVDAATPRRQEAG
jgi:diguanylate cyclase (GGDEF)-like protein/PAS domain S-box-containing protein